MKKISFSIYYIVYIIGLVVTLVSGTLLKLFATNPATGFVDLGSFPGDNILVYIFRLGLLIPIVFWFGITFKRRARHDYPLSYRHVTAGILSAITGVFMILYTFTTVGRQIINTDNQTYSSSVGAQATETGIGSFMPPGLLPKMFLLLVIITGCLGGFSLIISGSWPKYLVSGKPGSILGFTPALWQLIVLLARFNNFIAITTITDIMMIVLFMCFAAIFLIGQSRIIFGLGIRNGKTYAIPAGLSVSLIGLSFTIPSMISFIVNRTLVYALEINLLEFGYVFFLSLYAVVFVRGFARSIKVV